MNFLKFLVLVGTKKWLPGTKFGTKKWLPEQNSEPKNGYRNKIWNQKMVTETKFGTKKWLPRTKFGTKKTLIEQT